MMYSCAVNGSCISAASSCISDPDPSDHALKNKGLIDKRPISFFAQDLVSVKLGGDKGGELITLGHIHHRVVCTPDFEQLLGST